MNARRKASSTEDLLELIRGDDSPVADRLPEPGAQHGKGGIESLPQNSSGIKVAPENKACGKSFQLRSTTLGKRPVIGVDVRDDCIDFARLAGGAVQEVRRVDLEPGVVPGTEAFADVLRASLSAMAGPRTRPDVWVVLRSSELDMTVLTLPKKAAGSGLGETVYWKLKKDKKFDETESIFDFRNEGFITEGGIEKVEIMTAMAARSDVETLAAAFADAGCEPRGILPVPSVLQNAYGCKMVPSEPGLTVSVHIDTSFSSINIFDGSRLHFSRIIKSGANSMGESLMMHFHSSGIQVNSIAEVRESLMAMLSGSSPGEGLPGVEMDENQVFAVVSPALNRLSRQAERTIQYYTTQFERRCDRVHFTGEPFASNRVAEFMGSQLGLPYEVLGFTGEAELPRGTSAISFTPAILAALSDEGSTLNLLHNYRDRAFAKVWKRIHIGAAAAGLFVLLSIFGVFGWMKLLTMDIEAQAAAVQAQYNAMNPKISRSNLEDMAAKLIRDYRGVQGVDSRYAPLAALAELTHLTPENVRLLGVNMSRAGATSSTQGNTDDPVQSDVLVVDAVVLNSPEGYEASLSRFLVGFESSPIFGMPTIHSATLKDMVPEGQVYHVVLHVGVQ